MHDVGRWVMNWSLRKAKMRIAISCYLLPPQRKYSSDDWLERRKNTYLSHLCMAYIYHVYQLWYEAIGSEKKKGSVRCLFFTSKCSFLIFLPPPISLVPSFALTLSFLSSTFLLSLFFLSALPLLIQGGWANDINNKNNSDKSKKIIKKKHTHKQRRTIYEQTNKFTVVA